MGKASKWFRLIFGLGLNKKSNESSSYQPGPSSGPQKQPKKKWSFVKSHKERGDYYGVSNVTETSQHGSGGVDPDTHAIAVAAATAAVAEAAVAAAHAAAAVVRLTSSGRATTTTTTAASGGYGSREEWAAVKIQSHFRAYLSRRALRALKALVKLQAYVRGHIARKQTGGYIRRVQALLRVQARARAGRSQSLESPYSVSKYTHPGPPTPEKFEHVIQAQSMKYDGSMMLKRNGSKSNGRVISDVTRAKGWDHQGESLARSGPIDDKRSDKILEIDTGKPHITPKRRNLFHSSHLSLASEQYSQSFTTSKESTAHQSVHSPSSCEVQSFGPQHFTQDLDEGCYYTADSSPQFLSASSRGGSTRRGPFTPTKSDGTRSYLSGYSDHPNYMSFTESSRAKVRSLSAPKQRPNYERSSSTKRCSIHSFSESKINPQRVSSLHANFASKAYPGSGRLDRLGMPVGGEAIGFSGGHWHRF